MEMRRTWKVDFIYDGLGGGEEVTLAEGYGISKR